MPVEGTSQEKSERGDQGKQYHRWHILPFHTRCQSTSKSWSKYSKDSENSCSRKVEALLWKPNIFGLYLGVKLLSSFKILQDDDIMTPNMLGDGTKKYYFQRVALDFSKESSVIECVEMVTEILYCEVKEMYNRKLIWPLPTDEQAKEMKQLIEQAGSDPKKHVEFLKYIREELREFYWNHYHRVDNCELQSKVTAAEPRAQEGSIVSVSVNFATLIITYIGDEGKPFEFIFNWDKVRSLDLDRGKYCVIFEVLIENVPGEQYKNILRAISIHCDQYEYIFSISK